MRLLKNFGAKAVVLAAALSVAPAAVPSYVPLVGVSAAQADHYHKRHGGELRIYVKPHHSHRHHHRRDRHGDALADAIIELGVRALNGHVRSRHHRSSRYYRVVPSHKSYDWYD